MTAHGTPVPWPPAGTERLVAAFDNEVLMTLVELEVATAPGLAGAMALRLIRDDVWDGAHEYLETWHRTVIDGPPPGRSGRRLVREDQGRLATARFVTGEIEHSLRRLADRGLVKTLGPGPLNGLWWPMAGVAACDRLAACAGRRHRRQRGA